jgi:hypothetical protein
MSGSPGGSAAYSEWQIMLGTVASYGADTFVKAPGSNKAGVLLAAAKRRNTK